MAVSTASPAQSLRTAQKGDAADAAGGSRASNQHQWLRILNGGIQREIENVFDGIMAVWRRLKEDLSVGEQIDASLLSKFNTLDQNQLRELFARFAVLFSGHFVVDEESGEEGQAEGKVAVEQVLASRRAEVIALIMQP